MKPNSIYEAAKATQRLTKNGHSPEDVGRIVHESYGFTAKQVAPLLVDARGLSPEEFKKAKREVIRTTEEQHRRSTATPFQPKHGGTKQ
jgi:hypothetical protein